MTLSSLYNYLLIGSSPITGSCWQVGLLNVIMRAEMGAIGDFCVFIYQNLHKSDLIHQQEPYSQTHRMPARRQSSTLKDRKEFM